MPSAQDWVEAALTAISEGGLAAVAVEPLAVRLGTTKGSFYWHFRSRDALVDAVLAHWEESNTRQVIARAEAESEPMARLRTLFAVVPAATGGDPVEIALMAAAGQPRVAAVLTRVTERRIAYVSRIIEDLGFPPDEARLRGLLLYNAHLGKVQLINAVPQVLPTDLEQQERYRELLLFTVLRRE
ncbi:MULTISPECIES: TetR/AcrR family transcriptional regulator [Actinomadura]|uniref:TetR/AcrR family transcriptional regulator n=1 Tax=Actinomadura TaxID=1988 RepID=UPI0031E7F548